MAGAARGSRAARPRGLASLVAQPVDRVAAGRVLDAPGAAVVTSTRTDLLELCAPIRQRTRGPVFVFNLKHPHDRAGDGQPASATEVLGSAPPRGHVEAHAAYRSAHRAAGLPDHQRDELECSPAGHRVRVRAWEREQAWGPAYVENLLAGTRQAEARHRQTAELRRAEADAQPEVVERERLAREADHAAALAESLDRHGTTLDQQSQTYAEWYAATAMTRALGEASAQYLTEQHATDEPEPAVTAEEWLALDRATRHEDDAHRDIADIDVDERSHEKQTRGAETDDHDRSSELDRAEDGQAASPEAEDSNREHVPVAETDVADIRETAEEIRSGVDEDTVHAPDADQVAAAAARAHEAAAELRNREALEARHEADERARQLAEWHEEDAPAAEETVGTSEDEEAVDSDDYVDVEG